MIFFLLNDRRFFICIPFMLCLNLVLRLDPRRRDRIPSPEGISLSTFHRLPLRNKKLNGATRSRAITTHVALYRARRLHLAN